MRELSPEEVENVSGGATNVSRQISSVIVSNSSVSVRQKVVQTNGETLVNKTRVRIFR